MQQYNYQGWYCVYQYHPFLKINGTANHCHIIFRLEITGLQAIEYHENDAKIPWYWIGTKKSLNDMEWLRKTKLSIQICIDKEWDIRKSTKNFASLSR